MAKSLYDPRFLSGRSRRQSGDQMMVRTARLLHWRHLLWDITLGWISSEWHGGFYHAPIPKVLMQDYWKAILNFGYWGLHSIFLSTWFPVGTTWGIPATPSAVKSVGGSAGSNGGRCENAIHPDPQYSPLNLTFCGNYIVRLCCYFSSKSNGRTSWDYW